MKQQRFHTAGLSEKDQDICTDAIEIFASVCISVVEGSVTISVLEKLHNKRNEVKTLCEAITTQESQPGPDDRFPLSNFSFKDIHSSLNLRLREYHAFVEQQHSLSSFTRHLDRLTIPGETVLSL